MKRILCSLLVATLPFGSVLADAPKSKNAKVALVYQHELPIGDNGRPSRQRPAERSAAARAAAISWQTKAPTAGSNASRRARQRSRKSRGVSLPALKFAAMEKNGSACGIVIALLHDAWANLLNADPYPQVGPNTGMVGWP